MIVWAAAAAVVLAGSAAVGTGSAQAVQVGVPYPLSFQQQALSTSVVRSWATDPIDLDGDGDVDVPYIGSEYAGAWLGWLQNRGPRFISPGTFGFGAAGSAVTVGGWTSPVFEDVFVAVINTAVSLQAVDITGDSVTDLLLSSTYSGCGWVQSSGTNPAFFSAFRGLAGASFVAQSRTADVDGNGVVDIVDSAPSNRAVYWLESNGAAPSPAFTPRTVVALNQPYYWSPSLFRPCDLVSHRASNLKCDWVVYGSHHHGA
jgi:hypothetical protein